SRAAGPRPPFDRLAGHGDNTCITRVQSRAPGRGSRSASSMQAPMANRVETWVGAELSGGRYRIEAKLGEGGMGFVYRARDRNLYAIVGSKVPRRRLIDERGFTE